MKKHFEVQSQDTMRLWPKRVSGPEELPELLANAVDKTYGKKWPYTVYIPPSKWDASGKRSKVFSMDDEGLTCFEDLKTEVKQQYYRFSEILYVEIGRMLLSSWITIHGMIDGHYRQNTISYNTVRDDLFDPMIERIRSQITPEEALVEGQNGDRLSDLKQLDLKFLNYTKESLLPGEKIINIIYQPKLVEETKEIIQTMPEHTHAVVLTDNELILIKEDNHRYKNIHNNYGVIKDFIPLNHVKDLRTESLDENLKMRVSVEDKEELDRIFTGEKSDKIHQFIEKFRSFMH